MEVVYDSNGDYSQIVGPEGDYYNYYFEDELMEAAY
jgi:hypothetical protein